MRNSGLRRYWLAILAIGMLVACGMGSLPGVFTTGDIRILALEPDLRECVVYEGMWLAILGENLGSEQAWESGENQAIFPPGIVAESVDLIGNTLFMAVPAGAQSGVLILDAGENGVAEIPITVESAGAPEPAPQLIGSVCSSNPPPSN